MFLLRTKVVFYIRPRHFSVCNFTTDPPSFGLLLDIDGVIARGKQVIPGVRETFDKYIVKDGKFSIPTVFVTNAGNSLPKEKARKLSEWLNTDIVEEQVILSYTPLKTLRDYHDKYVLISGQGPVEEIARQIGFKKVVTIDDVRKAFPLLDHIDHARRKFKPAPPDTKFPKIEAVLLNGEPTRWETSLQLITDLLLTNGDLTRPFSEHPQPHIPVLASNPDLHYVAEAHLPRFGHGAFLRCLEALYKKITGNHLTYTALIGKPSPFTYRYARQKILEQAAELNVKSKITCLYAIGDNIHSDVLGANLFNEEMQSGLPDIKNNYIRKCESILVKTGVYQENGLLSTPVNHIHRDFLHIDKKHFVPNHIVADFSKAVELVSSLSN